MITEWIVALALVLGAGFVFIAALGVTRLPDVLCRMHAATKAGAFGVGLMLFALALYSGEILVAAKAVLVVLAFYFTAPIAGHLLGRFAYFKERSNLQMGFDEWKSRELDAE
ncbi:MAG: hypothetical protein SynsKO_02800 [Synoicihabitans sp.]